MSEMKEKKKKRKCSNVHALTVAPPDSTQSGEKIVKMFIRLDHYLLTTKDKVLRVDARKV